VEALRRPHICRTSLQAPMCEVSRREASSSASELPFCWLCWLLLVSRCRLTPINGLLVVLPVAVLLPLGLAVLCKAVLCEAAVVYGRVVGLVLVRLVRGAVVHWCVRTGENGASMCCSWSMGDGRDRWRR